MAMTDAEAVALNLRTQLADIKSAAIDVERNLKEAVAMAYAAGYSAGVHAERQARVEELRRIEVAGAAASHL